MKIISPEYAARFKCIADKCTDNCCIGWEIGIDRDTLSRYRKLGGELGKRLADSIEESEDGAYFRLGNDKRCPFLNRDSLCDIIKEKGDDALCDICREHPRYYNVLTHRTEWGIGLSCEEAAKLILECDDIRRTVTREEMSEQDEAANSQIEDFLLFARERVFELLYESQYPFAERIESLLMFSEAVEDALDRGDFSEIYPLSPTIFSQKLNTGRHSDKKSSFRDALIQIVDLDFIDEEFRTRLKVAIEKSVESEAPSTVTEVYLTRLIAYFIHRYFLEARYDGSPTPWVKLAVISALAIYLLVGNRASVACLTSAAKAFSKEMEYNEENRDALLDLFSTERAFSTKELSEYLKTLCKSTL